MRKWLFGFLGVALIVFCSVFGYVSYQKHEGEVFKQNIEKKMPVDQINAHAKSYKEDATNVNNDMSLGQMLSIQQEAIEMGVNKQETFYRKVGNYEYPFSMSLNVLCCYFRYLIY